ncbi:MAG: flagellar biosynthetic protein FliO [Pseudohongiellaceae bacterium]|jgi:flagellar protein FliO/FliZ
MKQGLLQLLSLIALTLSLMLLIPSARAAEATPAASPVSILDTGSLVQMLLALGVVIVLIVGLSFAIRKFNMFTAGSSAHIRIVGGLALSNKDRLLLVQVGNEQLLISASPGRVSMVHEMREPIDADAAATRSANNPNFASLLQAVTQRGRS